jgi:hypothetical protein
MSHAHLSLEVVPTHVNTLLYIRTRGCKGDSMKRKDSLSGVSRLELTPIWVDLQICITACSANATQFGPFG